MKILVISSYYKPFNNASSLDIQKKIQMLKKMASKIDVVTVFEKNSLEFESIENLNIYRIKNRYKNYSASIKTGEVGGTQKNFRSFIKNKIIENILVPDPHVFWIFSAYDFIKTKMKISEYDFVITMSQTNSSHLVGLKLKERNKSINWITYWNDPWFANLNKYNKLREWLEKKLEKKVIENCNGFILFCDEMKEQLITKNMIPTKKIIEIDGFYEEYKKLEILENKVIKVVHTGDIYLPIRNLEPFIEALKQVNKKNKEYPNKVIFIFIGKIRDEKYLNELKKIGNVRIEGEKTYEECNEIIKKSDILLLFGNIGVKRIPSKIFDYISYSKPIITILGASDEPLCRLFKREKRGPILNNEAKEIEEILLKISTELENWNNIYTAELIEYRETNVKERLEKWMWGLK